MLQEKDEWSITLLMRRNEARAPLPEAAQPGKPRGHLLR